MNRYRAIGASDEPTETTKFDSTARAARVFGVRTMAAVAAAQARGTKLSGNRGVKSTVKMCIPSAAARQQLASARAVDIAPPIVELQADGAASYSRGQSKDIRQRGARAHGPRPR